MRISIKTPGKCILLNVMTHDTISRVRDSHTIDTDCSEINKNTRAMTKTSAVLTSLFYLASIEPNACSMCIIYNIKLTSTRSIVLAFIGLS